MHVILEQINQRGTQAKRGRTSHYGLPPLLVLFLVYDTCELGVSPKERRRGVVVLDVVKYGLGGSRSTCKLRRGSIRARVCVTAAVTRLSRRIHFPVGVSF